MSPFNGFPQPRKARDIGFSKRRPRKGCGPALLALFAWPWAIDMLLAGSRATT